MPSSRLALEYLATPWALLALATLAGCPPPPPPPRVQPPPPPMSEPAPPPADSTPAPPPPEAGVVKLGSVMMTGGLGMSAAAREESKRAFLATFEAGTGPLRRCYAVALQRNPSLAGSFDVEVVIARDGSLYELKPGSGDLDDPELLRCAEQVLRSLRYAPLGDGEYFSITPVLQFKPD